MRQKYGSLMKWILLALGLLLMASVWVPGTGRADEVTVDNGIPVIYIYIDESQGSIEDMLRSPDHSVLCYGTLSVKVPEGFRYSDFPDVSPESFEGLKMSIRGRGHSTWKDTEKKPFKIRLDKKADLFGLGKNKHWVLVANAFDETLMRDRITAWLGEEMGFAFTPRGVPVDVVMTGSESGTQYLGSYYFSENVRVDDNRLEIAELSDTDTDPKVITGGYLLQNGSQLRAGSPDRFFTSRGIEWATDTPSYDTEEEGTPQGEALVKHAQQEYIQGYIQHFEDVLFEEGTAYRDLMDVESAAKYWLVNMAALNNDAYTTGSTYLYKDRDPEGGVAKLYWGPLWDFDFAWDIRNVTDGFCFGNEWVKALFYDTGEGGFVEEVHKQWPALKALMEKLVEDGGIIDQYYQETKASAEKDYEIWHPEAEFSYQNEVDELKYWIRERVAWAEEHFAMLDHASHKVTFVADGKTWRTAFRTEEEFVEPDEDYPEIEGYTFTGWLDADGNLIRSKLPVTGDLTLTAEYVPDSELTHAKEIVFQRTSDILQYDPFIKPYTIHYTVFPLDAEDKAVKWSSSDEAVAKVDKAGVVTILGPGEVTIHAGLRLGTSGDFTLVITEEESLPVPSSIRTDREEIRMAAGEQAAIAVISDPSPARINDFRYEPDDPKVVSVNRQGILTAKSVGKTVVHVKTETRDENGKKTLLTAEVTVVVTGGAEPSDGPSKETEKETDTSRETETGTAPSDESGTPGSSPEAPTVSPTEGSTEAEAPGGEEKGFDWKWIWIPAALAVVTAAALVAVFVRKKRKP